tara:strand:- start:1391 stop:1555 length:165 start_codon:yes stop_codon:yes gene_type:complete
VSLLQRQKPAMGYCLYEAKVFDDAPTITDARTLKVAQIALSQGSHQRFSAFVLA